MTYSRDVKNIVTVLDFNGNPVGALKNVLDIEREIVFDDVDTLFIRLAKGHGQLVMDQEIIYRHKRYIVAASDDDKGNNGEITEIEAESAQIELGRQKKTVNLEAETVEDGLEIILEGTGWTIGDIEDQDGYTHSMSLTDRSPLYLVRSWARLSRHLPDYDTINRVVHFRRDTVRNLGEAFRYGKNVKEIKKTTKSPVATVIYPYGRGGLTIEAVNEGRDYLENYSWYEALGIPLEVAREKYKKEYIWEDNRFIYPGYLMAEAERRLEVYSKPQVAYEVPVSLIGDVNIGDYGYVVDEDWGIKIETRVVKLNLFDLRPWENKVEFNYLIEGIHDIEDEENISDIIETAEEKVIMAKNGETLEIGNALETLIQVSLTSYASFNAQIGFYLIGEASQPTLFSGYFLLGGNRVGPEIRQALNEGYNTISMTFIVPQIQEGSDFLEFIGMVEDGTFDVELEDLEVHVKGQNLLGAVSSKLPKANVVDSLTLPNPRNVISITDEVVNLELEEA